MESKPDPTPLVVIVGETASGKSALALELAKQFNGEIIAADSRTIYKDMNIGTAKPTEADQAGVPHHLLSVVAPNASFTVADFKQLADAAIADIRHRGRVPFLVGGSGLYIDAVIYDFQFLEKADDEQRHNLQALTVEELQALLREQGVPLPHNERNPRHLIRAIETKGAIATAMRRPLLPGTVLIGLQLEREILRQRITDRVEQMVSHGLLEEVAHLGRQYGWEVPAMQATGYKAFRRYIEGECTLSEAKEAFVQNDLHLAKRQRTWFKRNKSIHWISKKEEAVDLLTTKLSK
jgi:tRNA dimethylallyltransferase